MKWNGNEQSEYRKSRQINWFQSKLASLRDRELELFVAVYDECFKAATFSNPRIGVPDSEFRDGITMAWYEI